MLKKKPYSNKKVIRVISPSANIFDEAQNQELIDRAEKLLIDNGFSVEYSDNFRGKQAFLSGNAKLRSKDLMAAFKDKKVDIIISSQGGDNSNDLLDYLDFEMIAKNEKLFFGLSDITVLLNVIALKADINTYHGLDYIWGIGKNASDYTIGMLKFLANTGKVVIKKNPYVDLWKVIQEGTGKGLLLGGCLPSFCLLLGTKYDPLVMANREYLLILESIGQTKSEIKSMLTQIRQHKSISGCRGIIIGNFAFCEQKPKENDIPIESLVKEVYGEFAFPIVRIMEIGHCVENLLLPIGGLVELNAKSNKVFLSLGEKKKKHF
jgi:muramoyltetrapeptide carboxypeptidase